MFSSGKKPVNIGEELYLRPEDEWIMGYSSDAELYRLGLRV